MSGGSDNVDSILDNYVPGVSKVKKKQIHLARLTVCSAAENATEARELMEMLGLINPFAAGLTDDPEKS